MRYYYRCSTCLTTMTAEQRFDEAKCVCGGHLQLLGPVSQDGRRWLRQEQRPRCDGRCISALGPNCDCQCRGENHGKGLGATVTIYHDGGAVVLRPVRPEEAIRRAEEYQAAKAAVYQALADVYGPAWEAFRAGRYIADRGTWEALRFWRRELDAILALLTHKTRVQRLYALADRIRKGQFVVVAR